MKSYVALTRAIVGCDMVPGGTVIELPDGVIPGPSFVVASAPTPRQPVVPTADQQFAALSDRIASLEAEIAQRDNRDRQILAYMEKLTP